MKVPCQGAYYLGLYWKFTYAIAEAMSGCLKAMSVMASAYYVEVGNNKSLWFYKIQLMKKKILTIKQASQLIDGLTEYRIRQMCISGELPCFRAGKKYLISEDVLYRTVFTDYPTSKDFSKTANDTSNPSKKSH